MSSPLRRSRIGRSGSVDSVVSWLMRENIADEEKLMLSYANGPVRPLIERTIPQYLEETATRFSKREALIVPHQNLRLTWRDLLRESELVTRGLVGLGLQPGDRVGVWSSNCVEWVLLEYACARARLVLVNVN